MGDPLTMGAVMVGSNLVGQGASAIFGNNSGDEGGVVDQAPTMLPIQKRNLINLNQLVDANMGQGVDSYGGDYTAGAAGNQQQAFNLVQQLLQGGGGMSQSQDFLQNLLQPYNATDANNYFTQNVQNPTMQTWEQDVLPGIQEHFIGQGAGRSGAANRAVAKSGADMMTGLNATRADVLYGDKQQYTQNAMNAVTQNANVQQLMTQLWLSAGGTERGIEGEQLMEGYNDWQTEQDYNNPWLTNFLSTALGSQAQTPVVQQPSQTAAFNPGSAMQGVASLMPFMNTGRNTQVPANTGGSFNQQNWMSGNYQAPQLTSSYGTGY